MAVSIATGLLILRVIAGLTLAAHGAQKLFGWFGGSGFAGTMQMQQRLGFKLAIFWSYLVILGEFGGGLSVAFGFLTPLGAAGMFAVMFMAIAKSHWNNGFWSSKRGIEYPLCCWPSASQSASSDPAAIPWMLSLGLLYRKHSSFACWLSSLYSSISSALSSAGNQQLHPRNKINWSGIEYDKSTRGPSHARL